MIDKDKLKEADEGAKNQHPKTLVNNQRDRLRDLNESDTRKNKQKP